MKPGEIVFRTKTLKGNHTVIRYPAKKDATAMQKFINRLSQEKTFIRFQGEKMPLLEEQKYLDGLLSRIKNKQAVHLLAFCNNELIGNSNIDMKDKVENHVGVFGIAIAKNYRGEGVGNILTEKVLEEAEKNLPQLKLVTLGCFANNPLALRLYQKFGFVQYGVLPEGILHREKYIDHVYMYKKIR